MATKEVNLGSVRGPQGAAATVTVGKVTTGAAGSSAAVTNSGTSGAAILNFTIPRGAAGAQGTPTTVNGKSGTSITLTAQDVGARPSSWTPSAKDVGALPAAGWRYDGTEADTGKRWLDGQTVYRKVFVAQNIKLNANVYISCVSNVFTDPSNVNPIRVDMQAIGPENIVGNTVHITGASFSPQYHFGRNALELLRRSPISDSPSAPSDTYTLIFTIEYYYNS